MAGGQPFGIGDGAGCRFLARHGGEEGLEKDGHLLAEAGQRGPLDFRCEGAVGFRDELPKGGGEEAFDRLRADGDKAALRSLAWPGGCGWAQ